MVAWRKFTLTTVVLCPVTMEPGATLQTYVLTLSANTEYVAVGAIAPPSKLNAPVIAILRDLVKTSGFMMGKHAIPLASPQEAFSDLATTHICPKMAEEEEFNCTLTLEVPWPVVIMAKEEGEIDQVTEEFVAAMVYTFETFAHRLLNPETGPGFGSGT